MPQPELAEAESDEASAPDVATPDDLRDQMIKQLVEEGVLDDPAIEAALQSAPREVFAPPGVAVATAVQARNVTSPRRGGRRSLTAATAYAETDLDDDF